MKIDKDNIVKRVGDYVVVAQHDEDSSSPYDMGDCMPPMLRFNLEHCGRGRLKSELDFDANDIISLIKPEHCDTREKREDLLEIFEVIDSKTSYIDALRQVSEYRYRSSRTGCDDVAHAFQRYITDQSLDAPSYWSYAIDYFYRLEELCKIVGIPCINEQSNGYSQGDSCLVFMAATDEWLKTTGVEPERATEALMADYKMFSAWCWGDCYGWEIFKVVTDEDGDESYEDTGESCWGYYGSDHQESGLLEAATSSIISLSIKEKEEAAAAYEAACRDIATV